MASEELTVIYGSQTGQAEAIAKELHRTAVEEHNLKRAVCYCTSDIEHKFQLNDLRTTVIVISSTGDGEPPENARKFLRRLCAKDLKLPRLRYALLGLGDSNYSTFHGCPKRVEEALRDVEATSFYATGLADDAVGLELVVEPWLEGLWPALKKELQKIADVDVHIHTEHIVDHENNVTLPTHDLHAMNLSMEKCDGNCGLIRGCATHPVPNLITAAPELAAKTDLRVPKAPQQYLRLRFLDGEENVKPSCSWQNGMSITESDNSPLISARCSSWRVLASNGRHDIDVKPKHEIIFEVDDDGTTLSHEPGDAYYVLFDNLSSEVEYILSCCSDVETTSHDKPCTIESTSDDNKVPSFIPTITTPKQILTQCFEIRRSPGRPVLRLLAEYTSNEEERDRLLQLCSSEGTAEFTKFVRQNALSLQDVLAHFPSCRPPLARLCEVLPRLMPRPYSVSNDDAKKLRFCYSIKQTGVIGHGRTTNRVGACTEWLITKAIVEEKVLLRHMPPMYFRLPTPASLAVTTPLVMIAPGTGIAPFMAFLHRLRKLDKEHKEKRALRWLIVGHRRNGCDDLYSDELDDFLADGTLTRRTICQSRPVEGEDKPRYVQDAVKENAEELCKLFVSDAQQYKESNTLAQNDDNKPHCRVYMCGDAQGMSRDMMNTFVALLVERHQMDDRQARQYLLQLKKEHRYIEDVWA